MSSKWYWYQIIVREKNFTHKTYENFNLHYVIQLKFTPKLRKRLKDSNNIRKKHPAYRVSKCHGFTVVRPRNIFLSLRKVLRIVFTNYFFCCILTLFWSFLFLILIYYVFFGVIFALFLRKISNLKFWPHKKKLLECLPAYRRHLISCRVWIVAPVL